MGRVGVIGVAVGARRWLKHARLDEGAGVGGASCWSSVSVSVSVSSWVVASFRERFVGPGILG